MIDIKLIREKPDQIKSACQNRGVKCDIDSIIKIDEERKKVQAQVEEFRATKNSASKQIPKLKGDQKKKLIAELKKIDQQSDKAEKKFKDLDNKLEDLMYKIPNLPRPDVKIGTDESANEVIKEEGKKPNFDFKPLDYLTLTEKKGLIDIKSGAQVAGTRFGYIKGQLAELGNALFQYGKDELLKNGFDLVFPPLMIRDEMMRGLGYIEGIDEKDKYHLDQDGLYLIATGEHAIVPMEAGQILDEKKLPQLYFTYTPCFRREAGSYGKDTKGIFRVHQFDKMEMVAYARAGESDQVHDFLLGISEKLIKDLKIPYRVTKMVTGDLSFPSARTYDIESWFPAQDKYRETGSISTCTDFQARRLNIRYKDKEGMHFAHILNGTAYAMGRTLIAIIENYQTKEGHLEVPRVLQKYCNFKIIK